MYTETAAEHQANIDRLRLAFAHDDAEEIQHALECIPAGA